MNIHYKDKLVTVRIFIAGVLSFGVLVISFLAAKADEEKAKDQPFEILLVPAISDTYVLPHEVPGHALDESTIRMTACRGEYESGSFVIQARDPLANVRFDAGDLEGPAGTIPESAIDLRVVKVWYRSGDHIHIKKELFGLAPELLLKDDSLVEVDYENEVNILKMDKDAMRDADTLQPFALDAGTVKQCWLTVRVPEDAEAGQYHGTIHVQANGEAAIDVPVELRILPFDLDAPNMIRSIYYRGTLGTNAPLCTSEQKTEEQMLAELKDMVAHGVTHPTMYQRHDGENPDGSYDLSGLQRVLDLRREAGMGGGPLFTVGVNLFSSPELIKQTKALALKNGYTELYIQARDESYGEKLRDQRSRIKAAHDAGAKVFVANFKKDAYQIVGDLLDIVTISTKLDLKVNQATAQAFHAMGHKVMSYANPQGGHEIPETYRRNYGLGLWKAGYDGACTYAYQHSFGHGWDDFDGGKDWPLRDLNMAYPTVNGIIPTVEWEGYREGYDDLRYVATLENLIEAHKRQDGTVGEAARMAHHRLLALDLEENSLDACRAAIVDEILTLRKAIEAAAE
jgi:hypothetical protein